MALQNTVLGIRLVHPSSLILYAPETQCRAVVLWVSAVVFPHTQVNFEGIEVDAARTPIVLIGIGITHPLPDIIDHVIKTIRVGEVDGVVAAITQIIGLSVVETYGCGVAQLAEHFFKEIKG